MSTAVAFILVATAVISAAAGHVRSADLSSTTCICNNGWETTSQIPSGDGSGDESTSCYVFVTETRNFTAARQTCQQQDGRLAYFESEDEVDFLRQHITVDYWISFDVSACVDGTLLSTVECAPSFINTCTSACVRIGRPGMSNGNSPLQMQCEACDMNLNFICEIPYGIGHENEYCSDWMLADHGHTSEEPMTSPGTEPSDPILTTSELLTTVREMLSPNRRRAVIGISIGVSLAVIALLVALVAFYLWRRRGKNLSDEDPVSFDDTPEYTPYPSNQKDIHGTTQSDGYTAYKPPQETSVYTGLTSTREIGAKPVVDSESEYVDPDPYPGPVRPSGMRPGTSGAGSPLGQTTGEKKAKDSGYVDVDAPQSVGGVYMDLHHDPQNIQPATDVGTYVSVDHPPVTISDSQDKDDRADAPGGHDYETPNHAGAQRSSKKDQADDGTYSVPCPDKGSTYDTLNRAGDRHVKAKGP